MHNKLYDKKKKKRKNGIKHFLKENYKLLIIYVFILSLFLIPTGYDVYSPGGLLNLDKKVEIENAYKKQGSFNATYVTSRNGTIVFYLLAKVLPNWDLEKKSEITINGEEYEDAIKRGKLQMESSNSIATYLAYKKANKEVKIKKSEIYVLGIDEKCKFDLKVGDQIIKIDNKKIDKTDDVKKYLKNKKINDKIKITILRDDKKKTLNGSLISNKNEPTIGVYLNEKINVKTSPNINIENEKNESGASAGLMTTLQIYNMLISTDITKGLKIAGTGTIDMDGNVGEIDGIKYKLKGAINKKADIFICPKDNYEEAIKEQEKHNYQIKIIKAETFEKVLKELKKI